MRRRPETGLGAIVLTAWLAPGTVAAQGGAVQEAAAREVDAHESAAQYGDARDRAPTLRAGPDRHWVVGLAGQVDDAADAGLLATFDLGLNGVTWLSFAAGRNRAEGPGVVANVLSARIDHEFGLLGFGISVERWGDPGDLETRDVRASLYLQRQGFRVGIDRLERDIDIYYTPPPILGRTDVATAGLSSDGTGMSFRAGIGERWQVYGSRIEYDYSRNVSLLPRIARLNLLSASTLTLADSFLAESSSAGFERSLGERLFSVSIRSDESAVDGARFRSFDASWLFPVGVRTDLEITLGRLDADGVDAGFYGGLLFLIYGGG